jgi:hypothetical protein
MYAKVSEEHISFVMAQQVLSFPKTEAVNPALVLGHSFVPEKLGVNHTDVNQKYIPLTNTR